MKMICEIRPVLVFVSVFLLLSPSYIKSQPRPRFYLGNGRLELLRSKIASDEHPYDRMYAHVTSYSRVYDPVVCPVDLKSQSIAYYMLPSIAFRYLIDEDEYYFDLTKQWIDCFLSISWDIDDPQKEMYHSQVLYSVAIVYDWLYDKFTLAERSTYATRMMDLAYQYDECYQTGRGWCVYILHNLFSWKASGLSSVALALKGENGVNQTALDMFMGHMYDSYSDTLYYSMKDGTSMEGMSYYTNIFLGANMRYFYIEQIWYNEDRPRNNDDDLFVSVGIFLLYALSPFFYRWGVFYSDCGSTGTFNENYMLGWLATKKNGLNEEAGYFKFAQELSMNATRSHFYSLHGTSYISLSVYPDTVDVTPVNFFDILPLEKHFEDFGLYISKERWYDEDGTLGSNMLFFKSGPPNGHFLENAIGVGQSFAALCHEHSDQGSFHFHFKGRELFIEDKYVITVKTASHNLVTFTDERIGQYGDSAPGGWCFSTRTLIDEEGTSEMMHTEINPESGFEYLVANLTRIYPLELNITKYYRHLVYVLKKYILVFDEIEFGENMTSTIKIEQHFHSDLNGRFVQDDTTNNKNEVIYFHEDGDIGYKLFDLSDSGIVTHGNYTLIDGLYDFFSKMASVEVNLQVSTQENSTVFRTVLIPFLCGNHSESCRNLTELKESSGVEWEPRIGVKQIGTHTTKVKFEDIRVSVYLDEFRIEINEVDPGVLTPAAIAGLCIFGVFVCMVLLVIVGLVIVLAVVLPIVQADKSKKESFDGERKNFSDDKLGQEETVK